MSQMKNDSPITRISLNVPALERLLGGDSELEVELRQQVVKAFAKKHLDVFGAKVTEQISLLGDQIVNQAVEERIGKKDPNFAYDWRLTAGYKWQVKEELKKAINEVIEKEFMEEIKRKIKVEIDKICDININYWKTQLPIYTEKALNKDIGKLIADGVANRLKKAAEL